MATKRTPFANHRFDKRHQEYPAEYVPSFSESLDALLGMVSAASLWQSAGAFSKRHLWVCTDSEDYRCRPRMPNTRTVIQPKYLRCLNALDAHGVNTTTDCGEPTVDLPRNLRLIWPSPRNSLPRSPIRRQHNGVNAAVRILGCSKLLNIILACSNTPNRRPL